jgi:hypothetical protein
MNILAVVISALFEVAFEGMLNLPSRAIKQISLRRGMLNGSVSFYGVAFITVCMMSSFPLTAVAQNQVGSRFPSELDGVYTGDGSNFNNVVRGYPIRMDISNCDELYKTCGTMQYSRTEGLDETSDEVGRLTFYGETGCQAELGGRNPTGRCYNFAENFVGKPGFSESRSFSFAYTFVTLNEQTDGSFFWTYQQGMIATAWGYISPQGEGCPGGSLARCIVQECPLLDITGEQCNIRCLGLCGPGSSAEGADSGDASHRELQSGGLPIGVQIRSGINFPADYAGRWAGNITDLMDTNVLLGSQLELTVREGGCGYLNDIINIGSPVEEPCGSVYYPDTGVETNLIFLTHNECFEYVKGPKPANECYGLESIDVDLFFEDRLEEWDADGIRFMSFSKQSDGSFFWSFLYGTAVKGSGLIFLQ